MTEATFHEGSRAGEIRAAKVLYFSGEQMPQDQGQRRFKTIHNQVLFSDISQWIFIEP